MNPIIVDGQIYYDEEKNEYLVVTRSKAGVISYSGPGFRGQLEAENFIERFQPVNPADVETEELSNLLSFCAPGTKPKVGFIIS